MRHNWQDLTNLVAGTEMIIERVYLPERGIHIGGEFELPPLARLSIEDQVFVAAFIQADGSIKEMERIFGVSYPTIKNRLKRITGMLDLVKIEELPSKSAILERLERGEISVDEALELMK